MGQLYIFFGWGRGVEMGKNIRLSACFTLSNSSVVWPCPREALIRKLVVSGTNLKIKHVLQLNVSPTVTRTVIGSSTPFQARKQMSFHQQAPCRSKFMSHELRPVMEEREFSGNILRCL